MMQKINWDSVPAEQVSPEMQRKIISGEKLMMARLEFKDGFRVPLHAHENEQISSVFSGGIRFWFGKNREEVLDLNAGEVVVIPPNLPHEALMIGDVVAIDSWAPPRQDWLDGTDNYLREG